MTEYPLWIWIVFAVTVLGLMIFDLLVLHKKNTEIKIREALGLTAFFVAVAMCFCGLLFYAFGNKTGVEFLTGYIIEETLSLDNLFVFLLIFTHFQVPDKYQYRVLLWGIIGAIVLRGALILSGVALIQKFDWLLYVFGGFLIITALKLFKDSDEEPDMENNRIVKFSRKILPVTDDYHGDKFFIRQNSKWFATPLFLVLIVVDIADVVFAFDSIPAIFAITKDPFIIITSNVFAVMGLRALYFALAGIMRYFQYLKYGLSFILLFIGVKMIINHYYHADIIPTGVSLVFTVGVIAASIFASIMFDKGKKKVTGWVPGTPDEES